MTEDRVAEQASAAMLRLQAVLQEMHPQAAEIVTGHVAIERELRLILEGRFPNPSRLPNLRTSHVSQLLEASTTDGWALLVLDAASAYASLRNTIAHADNPPNLKRAIARLMSAMGEIGPRPDPRTARMGTVALAIVAALQIAFSESPQELGSVGA